MRSSIGVIAIAATGLLLAGCVSLPEDRGKGEVQQLVAARSAGAAQAPWGEVAQDALEAQAADLLARPVDADAAVQVALLKSPRLRALFADLGIAQADVYDATRLSNPSLGFESLSASGGGTQTTWSLSQGFMEVLFAGYRNRQGRYALLESQQRVAHEFLQLEADVRSAWQAHAAARLSARLRSGSANAARVSAELAGRFHEAGNISALQLAREQAAASSAHISLRAQDAQVAATRARLLALMGVEDRPDINLSDRLLLPAKLDIDLKSLQATALEQRLDLQALRTQVEWSGSKEAFTNRWRWINGVGIEAKHEREANGDTLKGAGASVELPVFNTGWGRKQRALALREAAEATLRAAELEISSDVSAHYAAFRAAEQNVAEYRDRLLPLQQQIVQLMQQRQNFMLVGAFELIEARQQDIAAWQGFIASLRDYATARSDLARAVGGTLPTATPQEEAVSLPDIAGMDNAGESR